MVIPRGEVGLRGGRQQGSVVVLIPLGALDQEGLPVVKPEEYSPAADLVPVRHCCLSCVHGCQDPPCSFARAQYKAVPKNPAPLIPGRPPERWDH